MKIRIGTRGSKLARWQAEWVARELSTRHIDTEIVYLQTLGDVQSGPLGAVGSQGLFTKEIQRALLELQVDLAVHSLKDLPTDACEGLELAAVPAREACGDALLSNAATSLDALPAQAKIGTGSARRRAQLLAHRQDLQVLDLRGNVDTRLRKLQDGEFDAIVLAEAGLRRLQLTEFISQIIPKEILLPAVGQGALGLEVRSGDDRTREAVQWLDDEATHCAVMAERALLRALRGGCLAPVGAWARIEHGQLRLDATVLNENGSQRVIAAADGLPCDATALGEHVASQLLAQGAASLLASARNDGRP